MTSAEPMKAVLAALVLYAAACGSVSAQDADQRGLTGGFRTNMVQAGVAACRKLKDDPRAAWVPPQLVDQSCTCVANKVADQISINDAMKIMTMLMGNAGSPNDADKQAFQMLMLNSVGTCLSEIEIPLGAFQKK